MNALGLCKLKSGTEFKANRMSYANQICVDGTFKP